MKIGKIENRGGVINLGEIYGNVTTNINKAFEDADRTDPLEILHQEILNLTELINTHKSDIDDPEKTLQCVGRLAEEATSGSADEPLVNRYLELINNATGKIPNILTNINSIKSLILGFI